MSELMTTDFESLLAFLEDVEDVDNLEQFPSATLESLARHQGHRHSAFLLIDSPGLTGWTPEKMKHTIFGRLMSNDMLDEYRNSYGKWSLFRTPGAACRILQDGQVSLRNLIPYGSGRSSEYLEEFLFRNGIRDQMTLWLDTGVSKVAFISLLASSENQFGEKEATLLRLLRPHLTNMLRKLAPRVPTPSHQATLTPRESEVASLVARGMSNKIIARELSVSEDCVKKHVSHCLGKLDLGNRTALAMLFVHRAEPLGSGHALHANSTQKATHVDLSFDTRPDG